VDGCGWGNDSVKVHKSWNCEETLHFFHKYFCGTKTFLFFLVTFLIIYLFIISRMNAHSFAQTSQKMRKKNMNEQKGIWLDSNVVGFSPRHGDNQPNLNVPRRIVSLEVLRKLNK
jgi:hypothetical protein